MSTPNKEIVIARPTNNVDREVRVIHAFYSQECLGTHMLPSSTASIDESREASRSYQNTGVQTLPPPNGRIYKLIYGREPPQADHARNMGVAAIGRYKKDPRLNPFELMYGAAYPAPPAAKSATYTGSGFQTANCDTTRIALARAKAKASLTAKRYRGAAARAGYLICAEFRDENIIHSEQYATTVRLDCEGNLLDGNIKGRYIPNIYGTLSQPELPVPKSSRETSTPMMNQASRYTQCAGLDALSHGAPYPSSSKSPTIGPQIPQEELPTLLEKVSALAPSPKERTSHLDPPLDDENGHVGSGANDFVVYDAEIAPALSASIPIATPASSASSASFNEKGKLSESRHAYTRSRRLKGSSPEALQKSSTSITPSPDSHSRRLHRHSNASIRPSALDLKARSQSLQLHRSRPGNVGQENTQSDIQSTTAMRVGNIALDSTVSHELNVKVSRSASSVSSESHMKDIAPWDGIGLLEGHDAHRHSDTRPTKPRTAPSARTKSRLSIPTAAPAAGNNPSPRAYDSTNLLTRNPSSGSRMRPRGPARSHSGDGESEMKRVRSISYCREMSSDGIVRGAAPTRKRDASPNRTRKPRNESWRPTTRDTTNASHTASGRVEKRSASGSSHARRPFAPYVPPAMRARAQQARNNDKAQEECR